MPSTISNALSKATGIPVSTIEKHEAGPVTPTSSQTPSYTTPTSTTSPVTEALSKASGVPVSTIEKHEAGPVTPVVKEPAQVFTIPETKATIEIKTTPFLTPTERLLIETGFAKAPASILPGTSTERRLVYERTQEVTGPYTTIGARQVAIQQLERENVLAEGYGGITTIRKTPTITSTGYDKYGYQPEQYTYSTILGGMQSNEDILKSNIEVSKQAGASLSTTQKYLTEGRASLDNIRNAPESATIYITKLDESGKEKEVGYTKSEAIKIYEDYLSGLESTYTSNKELAGRQIEFENELKRLGAEKTTLQAYEQAGYKATINEKGELILSTPKASEVVTAIYGNRPDLYTAQSMRSLGLQTYASAFQYDATKLIYGKEAAEKVRQGEYERLSEGILGSTKQVGESNLEFTGRFWSSPETIMDIYVPIITFGAGAAISIGGKALAGTRIGGAIVQSASKSSTLVTVGRALSSTAGQIAVVGGIVTVQEAPIVIETAINRPEMLGSTIGRATYDVGMNLTSFTVGAEYGAKAYDVLAPTMRQGLNKATMLVKENLPGAYTTGERIQYKIGEFKAKGMEANAELYGKISGGWERFKAAGAYERINPETGLREITTQTRVREVMRARAESQGTLSEYTLARNINLNKLAAQGENFDVMAASKYSPANRGTAEIPVNVETKTYMITKTDTGEISFISYTPEGKTAVIGTINKTVDKETIMSGYRYYNVQPELTESVIRELPTIVERPGDMLGNIRASTVSKIIESDTALQENVFIASSKEIAELNTGEITTTMNVGKTSIGRYVSPSEEKLILYGSKQEPIVFPKKLQSTSAGISATKEMDMGTNVERFKFKADKTKIAGAMPEQFEKEYSATISEGLYSAEATKGAYRDITVSIKVKPKGGDYFGSSMGSDTSDVRSVLTGPKTEGTTLPGGISAQLSETEYPKLFPEYPGTRKITLAELEAMESGVYTTRAYPVGASMLVLKPDTTSITRQGLVTNIKLEERRKLATTQSIGYLSSRLQLSKQDTVLGFRSRQDTSTISATENIQLTNISTKQITNQVVSTKQEQVQLSQQKQIQLQRQMQKQIGITSTVTDMKTRFVTPREVITRKKIRVIPPYIPKEELGGWRRIKKEGKRRLKFTSKPSKQDKGLLADWLSVTQSQARYGTATHPKLTVGTWSEAKQTGYMRVPTEELKRGGPRMNIFGSKRGNKNVFK